MLGTAGSLRICWRSRDSLPGNTRRRSKNKLIEAASKHLPLQQATPQARQVLLPQQVEPEPQQVLSPQQVESCWQHADPQQVCSPFAAVGPWDALLVAVARHGHSNKSPSEELPVALVPKHSDLVDRRRHPLPTRRQPLPPDPRRPARRRPPRPLTISKYFLLETCRAGNNPRNVVDKCAHFFSSSCIASCVTDWRLYWVSPGPGIGCSLGTRSAASLTLETMPLSLRLPLKCCHSTKHCHSALSPAAR